MDIGDGVPDWVINIDEFDEGLMTGWALDRQQPDVSIAIEISVAGGEKRVISANTFRPDLLAAGFGNGKHGFSLDISHWDLAGNTVTVRPFGVDEAKHATVISTDLATLLTRKAWSDQYLQLLDDLAVPFLTLNDA